ncbi:hypothetical protein B296_00021998 [Ensete ventricosum]|uniref:Uncharacterized protein n=1 Tax=Ensete ventricosum TaxID=4639 RepID=A0A427AEZ0_ENSVE|nr:hypothetical protein B296_00021998 [Ensete ventricosum]
MIEVSLLNEIFNLVFEVVKLLSVISVLPMDVAVSSLVPPLKARLDRIVRPEEPLLLDLEENLHPSRI